MSKKYTKWAFVVCFLCRNVVNLLRLGIGSQAGLYLLLSPFPLY